VLSVFLLLFLRASFCVFCMFCRYSLALGGLKHIG